MAKKYSKPNTAPLGIYSIRDLPKGEFIKRVDRCKACHGYGVITVYGAPYNGSTCEACEGKGYTKVHEKVYIRGEYSAFNRRYELIDALDINRVILKSGSVIVLAGFTY